MQDLHLLLGNVLLLDGAAAASATGAGLLEVDARVVFVARRGAGGTVELLFEDWLRLDGLELGLEGLEAGRVRRRVGAAAGVGHVVGGVLKLISGTTPV